MKVWAGQAGESSQPSQSGQSFDSILAAVATLIAAWPISTLLAQPTWLGRTTLLLMVITLTGIGARSLALRSWQVLTVQLVSAVLAAGALYGKGHLWHGLPTFQTLAYAEGLVREAITSAQKFSAPAPTTPGLIFVVGASLGLVALSVDYLAVTCRSPSLAGLPLLTVFLSTVANRGSALPAIYFLAAAFMWLLLVARAGGAVLRRWGTSVALAHTPAPQRLQPMGVAEHASMARMLGGVALVAAVVLPVVLPTAPTTFLASGLGRSSSVTGNEVGFSQSLNLAADLQSRSRAPVLQYTTADTSPPPLRVSVGSAYRPDPGIWLPFGRPWSPTSDNPELSSNPRIPGPTGLSADVPRRSFALDVRRNLLEDPYLAVPYPLVGADLGGVPWGADYQTQSVRVAQRPDSYIASYWHLEPTVKMLRAAPPLSNSQRNLFDLDLRLDGPYVRAVTDLTGRLISGKRSTYDMAMAIQQYLREDGRFTYSLTLAPPAKDRAGNVAGYDPLTNFLVTKQGYCVQFATAMVMMSRTVGIPARIGIGFLPGSQNKGVWNVVAGDAHAWPELYLNGIGWTRFEPTPSRGAPPAYAVPAASTSGTPADPGSPGATATPAPGGAGQKDIPLSADSSATPNSTPAPITAARWLTHGWGAAVLAVLIGLLGLLVVPAAAVWRRRRSLSTATSAAQKVEVEWELLISSLGDLGIAPEPSHTPRQQRAYYDREALLEGAASQALGRVVATLERSRYAQSATAPDDLSADTRQVSKAAAANRAGRNRLRAALWPSSGVTALRSAGAILAWRIRAPLRVLSNLMARTANKTGEAAESGEARVSERPRDPR
jgi:transglutaminase-like putative cysteine protease